MLCLGVFDDAFLYGFVLVGSFLFVTRGYVWIIPASSCKHFDSKTLLCIMIGADNVSIRLVFFFGGVSFGLRVFESIAILRSELPRGMVQPGWRSEHLGWVFVPRRGLGPGPMLQRRIFFACTCARGAGGRSSFRFMALPSVSCSWCVGSCNSE